MERLRIGLCQSNQVLQCWRGQWKHLTGWDQTYHSCCPLPSLTQCGVVTMIKTADHQIHIYWETEHFVHALWFVIIWVSSVSAAASTFLFGTKNWEADQPQCRLDYRADDCLSLSLRCPRQTWKFYENPPPPPPSPKSSNEILSRPRLANSLLKTER